MAKKKVKKQRFIKSILIVLVLLFVLYLLVSPSFKRVPIEETTTTTIVTATTLETTITTTVETTTTIEVVRADCDVLRFKIMSSTFKDDVLSFYFKNVGSVNIDEFAVSMMYPDKVVDKKFENITVEPKEVEVHSVTVEPEFKNASIYIPGCPLLYRCQATANFCVFKEIF